MYNSLLLLITALLFYLLGRLATHEIDALKQAASVTQSAASKLKKRLNPPVTGAIDMATPASLKYAGSEAEKINEKALENMRKANLL